MSDHNAIRVGDLTKGEKSPTTVGGLPSSVPLYLKRSDDISDWSVSALGGRTTVDDK
jgi:hypothetical protein